MKFAQCFGQTRQFEKSEHVEFTQENSELGKSLFINFVDLKMI